MGNHQDIDLSEFDDDYESADVEENEFDPVPDGKYQVNIERVELTRSKTSQKPMLKWELRIIGPQYANRVLFRNNVFSNQMNIKFLKGDFQVCGLHLEKFSDLSHRLSDLLDIKLEVYKKTNGEFENIYFNKKLEFDDYEAPATSDPLDDIPF